MIYFTSTLLNIMVYLITFAVMWNAFRKREKDLETEYRLNYARMCSTFTDAMNTVSKALTDPGPEPETPTMTEWALSLCRSSGCHYFDGFGCTRSDVVTDGEETCPCDIDGAKATNTKLCERQTE